MFKKLIGSIVEITNADDFNVTCAEIEIAYLREKITWKERELLFALLGKISV